MSGRQWQDVNVRALHTGSKALVLALVMTLAPYATANDVAGEVEQVRGEAAADTQGTERPLLKDERVFVGDLVRTGENARLGLRLGKATIVKLGALSRLKIDRYIVDAGGEFDLETGSVQFERASKSRSPEIKFKSAYGLIAVRGTRFYAGPSQGKFGVLVDRGRVAVKAAGKTVLVGSGQGTEIAAPGRPPSTPRRWRKPRIADMVARFRP